MRVVVVGATGFIGRQVTAWLLDKGFEVQAAVRNVASFERRFPGVPAHAVDLARRRDPNDWEPALSGAALIWLGGWDPWERWLLAAYALYLLVFLCWAPVVWLQLRMRDLVRDAVARGGPLPPEHARRMRAWFALGWPAFLSMLALLWLMDAKPEL